MNTKFYDILGVSPQDSEDEIIKAYRKLAREWHPDSPKNRDRQEEATEKFKEIGNAYKVLSDTKTRQIYDQFGEEGVQQMGGSDGMPGGFPGGFNPFENLFPGMGGRSRGPQKCQPILHRLEVPLADLYTGKEYKTKVQVNDACGECGGTGSKSGASHSCQNCGGKGIQVRIQRMGPIMQQFQEKCGKCQGSGKTVPDTDKCPKCSGKEYVDISKEVDVEIKPGMAWGNRFMMEGMGHSLRDQIPGDLVIEIIPKQDSDEGESNPTTPIWERKENNLEVTVPVTLNMALTGINILLKTLDNRYLKLFLGKEIINPKTRKIIKGEGMPIFKQENFNQKVDWDKIKKGDLIIGFEIEFPDQLSNKDRQQLTQILTGQNNNNKNNNNKNNKNINKNNKNNNNKIPSIDLNKSLETEYGDLYKENNEKSQKVTILDYKNLENDNTYNNGDESDPEEMEFDPREQCVHQ